MSVVIRTPADHSAVVGPPARDPANGLQGGNEDGKMKRLPAINFCRGSRMLFASQSLVARIERAEASDS